MAQFSVNIRNCKLYGVLCIKNIPDDGHDDKRHIRAIYQNCPNLKYLKLIFENTDFSELKELLINCRYLNGLVINSIGVGMIYWKY